MEFLVDAIQREYASTVDLRKRKMNKRERQRWKKLKKTKIKRRIPVAPPGIRHKTKKDYKRVKKIDSQYDE